MQTCMQKLKDKRKENKYVCVGLDVNFDSIPKETIDFLRKELKLEFGAKGPVVRAFNQKIIEATRDIAAVYKYNLGFYLADGLQGFWALQESVEMSRTIAPNVPIILDGKFGDVGLSSRQYAKFVFKVLGVDAVTVNPWGGLEDGLDAFLEYKDKGIFVWCKSSNNGAKDFQDPLYRKVAGHVAYEWNKNGNCGMVVGATHPESYGLSFIGIVREIVGDMPILVPGIGAQKGDLEKSVKAAIHTELETGKKSLPAIFNSSRGIIYASNGENFAEDARQRTLDLNAQIVKIFEEVSA